MNDRPISAADTNVDQAPTRHSRIGVIWLSLIAFVTVLLLLGIFILQNSDKVAIAFLGFDGTISFGVAMLLSAIAGSILTLLIGSVRIVQLKLAGRRTTNV